METRASQILRFLNKIKEVESLLEEMSALAKENPGLYETVRDNQRINNFNTDPKLDNLISNICN